MKEEVERGPGVMTVSNGARGSARGKRIDLPTNLQGEGVQNGNMEYGKYSTV